MVSYRALSRSEFVPSYEVKRSRQVIDAVLRRDFKCCQCCYSMKTLEVHHIHPLCYGGRDVVDNAVVLCRTCHKHAPDSPQEFLAYQRQGGMSGQIALAKLFYSANIENVSAEELLSAHLESRHLHFEAAIGRFLNEPVARMTKAEHLAVVTQTKRSRVDKLRQFYVDRPDISFTLREAASQCEAFNISYYYLLVKEGFLLKRGKQYGLNPKYQDWKPEALVLEVLE